MKNTTNPLAAYAGLSLTLFLLWLLLTASLDPYELLLGAVVSIIAAIATPRLDIFYGFKFTFYTPVALLRYLLHFFIALAKSNIDLARRLLSPSLPLNPEVVEVETRLESRLGKLLLANSITLTPGTLTVDIMGDRLLVHWIDATPGDTPEITTKLIASKFESHIKGFLK